MFIYCEDGVYVDFVDLAFKIHPRVSGSCAAVKYRTLDGRGLCCERTCM